MVDGSAPRASKDRLESGVETNPMLRVLRGLPVARAPIWLMRQAGRYLPEYRLLRSRADGFLQLCYTPALAVEITLQPVRRFGMDGAILFSDILVVADALGCPVEFVEGLGPRLDRVQNEAAIARLSGDRLHRHLAPVYEAVGELRAALPRETALIGFAGAPWTVAAYMVEGEGSREFSRARAMARRDPDAFGRLIDLVADATAAHLIAQIEAGAQVVQLFDSWAGVLPEPEFARWCIAPTLRVVEALRSAHPEVPVIAFPRGAGALYRHFAEAVPVAGLSLDTGVPLSWARRELAQACLQGNLDPVALLVGGRPLLDEAQRILESLAGHRFIFNLGHGVLPDTDPDEVAALVDHVKAFRLPEAEVTGREDVRSPGSGQ
jgi:uroporphyrinogen decarboxylase